MGVEGVGREGTYWRLGARKCDGCKGAAVLFCRADAAFLCGTCDARVHGANKLASRHERVWLCEVCEQAPAAVTCKADAACLCASCDADIHAANPLASRHHRLPIVPFLDSPALAAAPSALLFSGDADTDADDGDGVAASWLMPESPGKDPPPEMMKSADDCFFSDDVDPYLDLEYGSSVDAAMYHADSVVPAAVGAPTSFAGLDVSRSKAPYSGYTVSHSLSSSEVGVVPDGGGSAMADVSTTSEGGSGGGRSSMAAAAAAGAGGMDREARVMRYREKRKNRRFEKTIRYASRKAYAETRPRIKGRFAKRTEVEAEVDRIYLSAADVGYGVVPSF